MKKKSIFFVVLIVVMFGGLTILNYFAGKPQQVEEIRIEMIAKQFSYAPSQIVVNKGITLILEITTLDVAHGIQIPSFDIFGVIIAPGKVTIVEFVTNKVGSFDYFCDIFCGTGHINHIGKLIVE